MGVSTKNTVSRRFIEASAAQFAALSRRSLGDLLLLVIYIDGIVVDGHHIIAAVDVDEAGDKHMLIGGERKRRSGQGRTCCAGRSNADWTRH